MFIAHRINYLDAEKAKEIFSEADGIEFDVRDGGVGHDPWTAVQPLEDFLQHCPPDKFYIVNIKCEGIEEKTIELMEAYGLRNFFLLDCGVPSVIRLSKKRERRLAVRYSEYESLDTVLLLADKVQWVWTDVFSSMPLTKEIAEKIRGAGLRICLVSPELQGQPDKIVHYRDELIGEGITIDAVCSKIWNRSTWLLHDALFPCPN
jgi:hypothetical protein